MRGFFEQVLRLARELGAPRVGRVAVDGSKIRANASKHKAMSYGRLGEKQRQLREEVQALLEEAEATDSAEDAEHGPERRGDELPAELRRRASRLQRIREATRALEARAKDEAAAAGQPAKSAKPAPKAQYNFTDPESRIMKSPDGFVQAYNVQVAVDELQLIVGQAVTQETNDKKQLMPMITTIAQQSGDTPTQLLADAGYCSDRNLTAIGETSIDAFISTRKQTHGERPGPCPRGPLPKTATIIDRMSRTLHTKAGAAVYAARKGIVEPVIGQIKQTVEARAWAATQAPRQWRLVSWRNGTHPPWRARFCAVRVTPAHDWRERRRLAPEVWLLCQRDLGATPVTTYYVVDLPATTALRALVRLAHQRWAIEQQYQELKDEIGLDHFEGRSLPGWQRHVVLTALAYSFLQMERRRRGHTQLTLPRVRAIIQEVLTAHFFITQPHYLKWMLKLKDVKLQI